MKMNFAKAAAALLALVAVHTVKAETATIDGITWTYTVSNGEVTLGRESSSQTAIPTNTTGQVIIPSKIGNYPVTGIGGGAFFRCDSLTSVTIPDSVTSIGHQAFSYCSGLTSVRFDGNSVTNIEKSVFEGVDANCSAYVKRGSTGWGVEIPGTWQGIKIAYVDEGDSGDGSGTNDAVATRCEVTAVEVKPRWPWNGLVDIDYTLQVEPTNEMAVVTVSGCNTVTKQVLTPRTLSGVGAEGESVPSGTHRLTWDIGMDYPQFHSEAFTVDVTATAVTNSVQENTVRNKQLSNGVYRGNEL